MSLFRPPLVRSSTVVLDKALFSKTIPIAAASVSNLKNISRFRTQLEHSKEILKLSRLLIIRPDPDPDLAARGRKCLLLKPEVKPEDPSTWSDMLQNAVTDQEVMVVPYQLTLDYDYWNYHEVMSSLLPEDAQDEIPGGFNTAGHIAHLNLRSEYLPYKKVIAQVIMDKNPQIKTVINKVDDVGEHSVFRTFDYELLAGEDRMDVEVKDGNCRFRFNYSKVYWNSKLSTEHERLVAQFQPGEVLCDVMAGIGPFAVPAGKKGVFVWANDLNPASFASMEDAIARNKVSKFVHPFCEDGHTFIHHAADEVLRLTATKSNTIKIQSPVNQRPKQADKKNPSEASSKPLSTTLTIPPTINHFVMNLPASAIEFLGSFNGLYRSHELLFEPHTKIKLPMIHVHCFSTKSDDNVKEEIDICERISEKLDFIIKPGDEELLIHEVRAVAPKKVMFCASFRLPPQVAFRQRRPPPIQR